MALEQLVDHYGRQYFVFDALSIEDDHSGRVEITLPMKPPNVPQPD